MPGVPPPVWSRILPWIWGSATMRTRLPIKFLHGVARQEPAVHEPRAVEGRAFSVPGERVDARVRREDPFRGTPAPEEEDGVGRVARGVDVRGSSFVE